MFRFFLSRRYLLHRRTNLIGIIGIMVAVGALIMILSIMTGFLEQTKQTIRGSLADLIVRPRATQRAGAANLPREPGAILELLRADPRVKGASAHLSWFCILARGGSDAGLSKRMLSDPLFADFNAVELVGIDLADEVATTEFGEALRREPKVGMRVPDPDQPFARPANYAFEGRPRASAVVGEQLAAAFDLARGDEFTLATVLPDPATGDVQPANRSFVVSGTFRTRDNEMDLNRIYVERSELADFLGSEPTYSEILVTLHDYEQDGVAARAELAEKLHQAGFIAGLPDEVRTWEQFRRTLLGAIENERVLMAIMLSLVLLVAGFTVFAILSMMATEKRRDIGVLTALGATPRGVASLFLMIAFWDALIGASLGALFGTWAALEIDGIEQWLSRTFNVQIFNRQVYYFDTIPSVVQPLWVAVIVLGAFSCALVFAAIPAWRAARLDPLEALRYE